MRHPRLTTLFFALAFAFAMGVGCAGSQRTPARTADTGMAQLIAKRIAADPRLCPFAISVAVHDRTARLQGKVATDADRRRAEQLSREAGAASIEDLLTIDPAAGQAGMC